MPTVECPACGKVARLAAEHVGRRVRCPRCGLEFQEVGPPADDEAMPVPVPAPPLEAWPVPVSRYEPPAPLVVIHEAAPPERSSTGLLVAVVLAVAVVGLAAVAAWSVKHQREVELADKVIREAGKTMERLEKIGE